MNVSFVKTIWIFFAWIVRSFMYTTVALMLLFGILYVVGVIFPHLEGSVLDIRSLKNVGKKDNAWEIFLKQHFITSVFTYVLFYIAGFMIQIHALKVTIQKHVKSA